MAYLEELTSFKEEALRLIVTNPRIMQAVVNNEEECFLNLVENPGSYLYKNIFPYRHTIPEVEKEKKTYITMDFANFALINNYYKDFTMGIYVFTHKDLMKIKEDGHNKLRVDFIISEIDKIFNRARGFGIGRLQFSGLQSLTINNNFLGSVIIYETIEFNSESPKT